MLGTVGLRFTPGYNERVMLRNGAAAELRLIRPDDKELLLRGFHELSSTSRYLRFSAGSPPGSARADCRSAHDLRPR